MSKQAITQTASSMKVFVKQAIKDFSHMGAVVPTSVFAAKAMAKPAAKTLTDTEGWVVELGAGTGVITKALAHYLSDPKKIIAIEQSAQLADYLQQRFPFLNIIHGDAVDLPALLGDKYGRVATVVSALPFRILPKEVADKIVANIHGALMPGGKLVQITYSWRKQQAALGKYFVLQQSSYVFLNIPPARVDEFVAN